MVKAAILSEVGPLAQLAEQLTLNQLVGGSSPPRLTIEHYPLRINNRAFGCGSLFSRAQCCPRQSVERHVSR